MQQLSSEDISDLLVAYALDALEPEDIERVHVLLQERPELRAELTELQAVVEQLPYGLPESPPPADLRQRAIDRAVGRTSAPPPPRPTPWWLRFLRSGGLAAILATLLLIVVVQLLNTQAQLTLAQAQLAAVQREAQQVAAALARPVDVAELAGEGGRGTALVSPEGQLLLVADLPQLAEGRVYQLWVIAGDNAPQSAGIFEIGPDGYGTLVTGAPAGGATLAVTDEPAPGSPGPTTPILMLGEVSS